MRLKTITAPDMPAAMKILRSELGPEALILSTRKVPGGRDGNPTLEITAALPEPEPTPPKATTSALQSIARQLNLEGKPLSGPMAMPGLATLPSSTSPNHLGAHSLPEDLQTRLNTALQGLAPAGFTGTEALEMILPKLMTFLHSEDQLKRGHCHVFLGPHGAGKTTFLAKLALQARQKGYKLGLLSLDDQKIAGFEPLAIAAEAVGDAAILLHTPSDLQAAAQSLGPRPLMLLDTPGLTGSDAAGLAALHNRLNSLGLPLTCHLVLPANLHPQELMGQPIAFQRFAPASVIFTKLDATGHMGGLMATATHHKLAVGLASDSPRMDTPPLTLTPAWLAARLGQLPYQPWEQPQ